MPMKPAKKVKKVSKVGEGLVIFVTQEARLLGWTNSDYVSVQIDGEGKDAKLIIRKIDIEH